LQRDLVRTIAFSPPGTKFAAGGTDGILRIFSLVSTMKDNDPDIIAPTLIGHLEGHWGEIINIAWSHDGQSVVSGSRDGTARIWRWRHGEWKSILCKF